MIPLKEMNHKVIEVMKGRQSLDKLTKTIKQHPILLSLDTFVDLEYEFDKAREHVHSLFSLDEKIVYDVDHTEHNPRYAGWEVRRDRLKFWEDKETLEKGGYYEYFAFYHTHPEMKDCYVPFGRKREKEVSVRVLRDGKKRHYKKNYPSPQDIILSTQFSDQERGYMLIGAIYKNGLKIGAYLPVGIADFNNLAGRKYLNGYFSLKQVKRDWESDTKVEYDEVERTKHLLRPILNVCSFVTKENPNILTEYYFLELPIKIDLESRKPLPLLFDKNK